MKVDALDRAYFAAGVFAYLLEFSRSGKKQDLGGYEGELEFVDACLNYCDMLTGIREPADGFDGVFVYQVAEPFGRRVAEALALQLGDPVKSFNETLANLAKDVGASIGSTPLKQRDFKSRSENLGVPEALHGAVKALNTSRRFSVPSLGDGVSSYDVVYHLESALERVDTLIEAGEAVVKRWDSNSLADAVFDLQRAVEDCLPDIDQDRLEKAQRAGEVLSKLMSDCESDPALAAELHDSLLEIARRVVG